MENFGFKSTFKITLVCVNRKGNITDEIAELDIKFCRLLDLTTDHINKIFFQDITFEWTHETNQKRWIFTHQVKISSVFEKKDTALKVYKLMEEYLKLKLSVKQEKENEKINKIKKEIDSLSEGNLSRLVKVAKNEKKNFNPFFENKSSYLMVRISDAVSHYISTSPNPDSYIYPKDKDPKDKQGNLDLFSVDENEKGSNSEEGEENEEENIEIYIDPDLEQLTFQVKFRPDGYLEFGHKNYFTLDFFYNNRVVQVDFQKRSVFRDLCAIINDTYPCLKFIGDVEVISERPGKFIAHAVFPPTDV